MLYSSSPRDQRARPNAARGLERPCAEAVSELLEHALVLRADVGRVVGKERFGVGDAAGFADFVEILMFDCDGSSPGFSTALAVVAGRRGGSSWTWDGASAGFGGSEAQPAADDGGQKKRLLRPYFMDNSLARRAPGMGRGPV